MLLFIGMVMEPSAIVLIMAPILYPVAVKLGVDPVHFGIMMVVNMESRDVSRRPSGSIST